MQVAPHDQRSLSSRSYPLHRLVVSVRGRRQGGLQSRPGLIGDLLQSHNQGDVEGPSLKGKVCLA